MKLIEILLTLILLTFAVVATVSAAGKPKPYCQVHECDGGMGGGDGAGGSSQGGSI